MENNKRDIRALFNTNSPLEIPRYQREYVWKEEEAEDLLDDLDDIDDENPLFLGNIILNKSDKKTKIVDGQQRITSILIFLIACRVFAQSKEFNPNTISEIQRYIVSSGRKGKITPILSTNERLQPVLCAMADQKWGGEYDRAKMGTKHAWNKLAKPYEYFYQQIEERYSEEKKLEELFDKILEIHFIEIIVNDEDEAIATFERVNARGQHLQVYDLLKAYLFSKEKKIKEDIEETWNNIKEYAENSDGKLKKILHLFYFSKKGYILPAKLYKELKNQAGDGQDLEKFVKELRSFAKFYALVAGKPSDNFMGDIKDFIETDIGISETTITKGDRISQIALSLFAIGLFKVSSVYPLLYSSLLSLKKECEKYKNDNKKKNREIDAWIDMLIFFEHFLFTRNRIAHNTSQQAGSLQKLYSECCETFARNKGDFSDNIKELKSQFTDMIKISENEFVDNFKDISYSNRSDKLIIYYVFDKLNNTDTGGQSVKFGSRNSFLHKETYKQMENTLEHFYPQSKRSSIKDEDQDEIDSIGNLLVMHRTDNSKLSDKSPKEKMTKIKGWIKDEKIRNNPYLERFVKDYHHLFEQEEWNPVEEGGWNLKEIEKRTEVIAKQIYWITAEEEYKDPNITYSDLR